MRDPRIATLTTWWCEQIYFARYGMVAPWSGKEAKMLQTLLANATTNFGEDGAVEAVGKAMEAYVWDDDKFFAKDKHPFCRFAMNPMRWMKKKTCAVTAPVRTMPVEMAKWNFIKLGDREIAERLNGNARHIVKGMALLGGAMAKNRFLKDQDPEFQHRLASALAAKLGAQQAKAEYLAAQGQDIVKDLP